MRNKLILLLSFICFINQIFGQIVTRDSLFNFDWKFHRGNIENAELPDFNDNNWRMLDLPHDWSIEDLSFDDNSEDSLISGPFYSKAIGGAHSGFIPTHFVMFFQFLRKRKISKKRL